MGAPVSITIEIRPELEAELARQAALHQMAVGEYATRPLEEAARVPAPDAPRGAAATKDVVEAIEQLRDFGKIHRLSLGGMTIREVRHEARP